ncbi:MAG: hypothetical protein ABI472_16470 [Ginsengibacter sp.]
MENIYSAYVRTVNGDAFYFVKKYQVFPEYKEVPPILEHYGMHTDFQKACEIAMISDSAIQQQLINELGLKTVLPAVIKMPTPKAMIYKLRPRHFTLPALLKLGWLGKIS